MSQAIAAPLDWRTRLGLVVESKQSEMVILALIVINAIVLGLETSPALVASYGTVLSIVDHGLLAVFVLELFAKVLVHQKAFPRDPWRIFDAVVVAIALVPSAGPFAVLRALRVLRVLRVVSVIPTMRRVVSSLLSAIPGLSSIISIMSLVFYVAAVIATKLFGEAFPEWFGNLPRSGYTLFQVMTLESWSMGIVRPVMERFPLAWAFFVPFILVATFTMLNLFIAVIVSAMQSQPAEEAAEKGHDERSEILKELGALRTELAALRTQLGEGQK